MWKWLKALNPFESDNYAPWMREEIAALRAELAAAEIELADKAFYVREFAAVSAERDALKSQTVPAKVRFDVTAEEACEAVEETVDRMADDGEVYMRNAMDYLAERAVVLVPQPATPSTYTDADVEALARVLRETHAKTCGKVPDAYELDGFRNDARAAMDWMGAPVGECKECEKLRKRGDKLADDCVKLAGAIKNARAALADNPCR